MLLLTERLHVQTPSGQLDGYLARPKVEGARPLVLVFMEIFGVNAHIRSVTERIAALGYVAFAPNFFYRTAPDFDVGYDAEGLEQGRAHMRALKEPELLADIEACLTFLEARPEVERDVYGATGFCVGGHVSYLAATTGRFKACASLYGGGIAGKQGFGGGPSPLSRAGLIRGRLLCLFGGKDPLIPPEQVVAVKEALEAAHVDHEIVVYEQASHAFFCELRSGYEPAAADDAWQRMSALFADKLGHG